MRATPTASTKQMETIPVAHIQTLTAFPVSTLTWMKLTTTATELMDIMTKT